MGISGDVIVSNLDSQTFMREFESHWVFNSLRLVPHLSKLLCKLLLLSDPYLGMNRKMVHSFAQGKVIMIDRLKFELANYNLEVHHISYYIMVTKPEFFLHGNFPSIFDPILYFLHRRHFFFSLVLNFSFLKVKMCNVLKTKLIFFYF